MYADCEFCGSGFVSDTGQDWYDEDTGKLIYSNFLGECPYCNFRLIYTSNDISSVEKIYHTKREEVQ